MYALIIWTIVASTSGIPQHDWRHIADFPPNNGSTAAKELCEQAAKDLALKANTYRCIRTL